MEELFFHVGKRSPDAPIEVYGCVTRGAAHSMGIPHTSVLLIPVTWDAQQGKPVIFVHKRSPFKATSPDSWDFCGGHLSFEEWHCKFLQNSLNGADLIERLSENTAVREANEELKCTPVFQFQSKHFHRFQTVGFFTCDNKHARGHNVEYSTAFVVTVPNKHTVEVWDTDREGERKLEVKSTTLETLLTQYKKSKEISGKANKESNETNSENEKFADGAGRILDELLNDPNLKNEFENLITSITKPSDVT